MLQKMRDNTQSWVTKLIIGLICLAFAVWGLESLVMPGNDGGKDVAKVNDENITQQQYYNALQSLQRQMAQRQMPIDSAKLHKHVMDGLIQQAVLLSYARERHMIVSDQEIDGLIMSMPDFQTNGKFDHQRFISLLRNAGMIPGVFKQNLKQNVLLSQLHSAISNSAFVTEAQLKSFAILEQQKRDFTWATLDLSTLEKKQKVSKASIDAYYKKHHSDFMSPEKVSVNYVVLSQANLAKNMQVADSDVQTEYQAYVEDANAKVKPEVSIILLKTDSQDKKKAQLKKAAMLEGKLKKGADFGALAKKYSDDKKSADKQGYIGHITPGFYGAVFDKTVAVLQPGQVSAPVETKFGIVIVKRVDNGKAHVKSLHDMRSTLVKQIQKQQAGRLFQDTSQKLADISFEAADLTQPAKALHLKIESTPFFSRDGGSGITANKKFIQAAFSDDVMNNGNNSDPVQISPTEVAVLHLKASQPSRPETLAEATPKIESILKKQQATKAITSEANNIIAALNSGKTEAQIASMYHVDWKQVSNAGRKQKKVPAPILQKAFALAHPGKLPSAGSTRLPSGDMAVVAVSKVIAGSDKLDTARKTMMEQALAASQGQMNYHDLVRGLHKQATIKLFNHSMDEQ